MRKQHDNTELPTYVNDVIDLANDLKPGVHHVIVEHEPHCQLLKRKGECNCEPVTKLVKPS